MLSDSIISKLDLSQEQREIYQELVKKENTLRSALVRCGVHYMAIDKIINKADFDKIPDDNALLDSMIQETWGDFIIKKGV